MVQHSTCKHTIRIGHRALGRSAGLRSHLPVSRMVAGSLVSLVCSESERGLEVVDHGSYPGILRCSRTRGLSKHCFEFLISGSATATMAVETAMRGPRPASGSAPRRGATGMVEREYG